MFIDNCIHESMLLSQTNTGYIHLIRIVTNSYMLYYSFTALLLPSVLVNIIVSLVYFYPRLRIRYPGLILEVVTGVSDAGYMTIHSISRTKPSEIVGIVGTASNSEPEGRGFVSRLVFFYFFLKLYSRHCLNLAQTFKNSCFSC